MSDTTFPDLSGSRPSAMADDQPPVLLNGMAVVFDQKVALYPVHLERRTDRPEGRDAGSAA